MSVQAISWVIDNSQHKGGELLTLLMIANYADANGKSAWPSLERLAKDTRLTTRAVQYHIRALITSGELIVEQDAGPHGCNLYTVPMTKTLRDEKISLTKPTSPHDEKIASLLTKPTSPNPSLTVINPSLIKPPEEKPPKRKKPMVDCPADFSVTLAMQEWARKAGFRGDRKHLDFITQTFLDHHASKGNRFADWTRAWQTWIRNSISYGQDIPKPAANGGYANGNNGNAAYRPSGIEIASGEAKPQGRVPGLRAALEERQRKASGA